MKTTSRTSNDPLPAAGLFKALAEPVRLRLLNLLTSDEEVCVCHLHETLDLPQPTVSRHLAALRKSGLVFGRKEGLWVYYRLARPKSKLHAALLVCLRVAEADSELLRRDRKVFSKRSSCST